MFRDLSEKFSLVSTMRAGKKYLSNYIYISKYCIESLRVLRCGYFVNDLQTVSTKLLQDTSVFWTAVKVLKVVYFSKGESRVGQKLAAV